MKSRRFYFLLANVWLMIACVSTTPFIMLALAMALLMFIIWIFPRLVAFIKFFF